MRQNINKLQNKINRYQTNLLNGRKLFAMLMVLPIFILLATVSSQAATYTVTKTADTEDGVCDADCSLREAINVANSTNNSDVIRFASPLFDSPQTILRTNGLMNLGDATIATGHLIIVGPGADLLTIDGNNDQDFRTFRCRNQCIAVITRLKLTNNGNGAIRVDGDGVLTIDSLDISGNLGNQGAGIQNFGDLTITNSTISGNSVVDGVIGGGGGIQNSNATLTINKSTISGNSAKQGGGLQNFNGSEVTINNSTISGNSVTTISGGGVYNNGATTTITNSTINGNSATESNAGGINNVNAGTVNARNTIFANNTSSGTAQDFNGTLSSQGYNLIEDTAGTTIEGDLTGNIIGQDPLLGDLSDNGGVTNTHELLEGSPAIDAADPNNFLQADQRNVARPFDGNSDGTAEPDIGAFESNDCGYNLPVNLITIAAHNTTVVTNIRSSSSCNWTSVSNDSWLTITSGASGSGNAEVRFSVDANSGAARTGTITIAGLTFTVNQASVCTYSLATSSADHPANGETGGFTVNTNSTCVWTATTNDGWINIVNNSGTGEDQIVYTVSTNTGLARTGTITVNGQTFAVNQAGAALPESTIFDFDGDGKTDISIFRPGPTPAQWWLLRSSDDGNNAYSFGLDSDKPVPADYTGDGKTDIAFFRESNSEWFILRSEDGSFYSFPFGQAGDIPAPGDFDGDGIADPAIFRPSTATWFILNSSGGTTIQGFGISEDKPVVADYDGDGKDDIAIYRPSVSQWWLNRSTDGVQVFQFGTTGDQTVQGDYTGDGRADVAFFRPSNGEWFVIRSEDQSFYSYPFGTSGDIPTPGDYDGDGTFDAGVFRPSTTEWFANGSTSGTQIQTFGITTDIPLANSFVTQ